MGFFGIKPLSFIKVYTLPYVNFSHYMENKREIIDVVLII